MARYFWLEMEAPGRTHQSPGAQSYSYRHQVEVVKIQTLGSPLFHLTDSMVCMHALTRGRSSSKKLRPVIMRLNALMLAGDLHPLWGYIHTSQNPADRPSRRLVKKKLGK